MTAESIGSCGRAQIPGETALASFEQEIGIALIEKLAGEPPTGAHLRVQWHEHDYGEYPTIALDASEFGEVEWAYYRSCERALMLIDDAVQWRLLSGCDCTDDTLDMRAYLWEACD